ncbi:ABC transporter ATP-binding protein [Micromonospora mangrovi]|uniref:ABC transporter ATP-binding protein n=2 Tax=Micromonospora TaxID=1873 RepID=A0AAU8HGE5_9ACTN
MTEHTSTPLLAVDGLSISFPADGVSVDATRDVAFELRRGRVLALVGESGSGKSVTAMAALGLLPATARVEGSIRLDGVELVDADPELLRQVRGGRIGTVFQEPMTALNPVLTVGHQITEAIRTHRPVGRRAADQRVHELLASVGLDDPRRIIRSYPHELSGGQLQRAMIAMAISCDPPLLIADEPTTALDVTVQAGILDLLRELRDRLDMAILLITHDMGVVADIADEVVVLRDGLVVEHAPVDELFGSPTHEYTRVLLDAVPRPADRPDPVEPGAGPAGEAPTSEPTVRLRDVVVEYPARRGVDPVRAVNHVSLHIEAGELLGLVGESGSGKSTVGRALIGLAPVVAGEVVVAGVDVARAGRPGRRSTRELRAVRSRTGFVFQDPASSLNPRWTVGQSVAEPLRLHGGGDATQRRRRVDELLDAVRLPAGLRDRYPHEMSGGQRQRVGIARALALDPVLLVADEPTSALDVSVQARVLELLQELRGEFGFACLFISHDLAVVEQLADRVAVMRGGLVVEQGPAAQVLGAPQHPYTRRLLAAAPVADPVRQATRRDTWRKLTGVTA